MVARRLVLTVVVSLCGLAAGVLPAAALAATSKAHVFAFSFAGFGEEAGQLNRPDGVAINDVTHDVYVTDRESHRVDEFSSSGAFIRAWGWGVADGLEMFETCTITCQNGIETSEPGGFQEEQPKFIAVDNSCYIKHLSGSACTAADPSNEDVYVGDSETEAVTKFTSSGGLVTTWGEHSGQLTGATTGAGTFRPDLSGVAVGAGGNLYVMNEVSKTTPGTSEMFEFTQSGAFVKEFTIAERSVESGLAVDPAGDFFKVSSGGTVEEVTGAGVNVGRVTASKNAEAVAVDPETGDLYVDEGAEVEHFVFAGPGIVSETGGATCEFTPTSGCPATDSFGSGKLSFGQGLAVDPASGGVYVAEDSENEIYVFAAVALPGVITGQAAEVRPAGATLNGEVNPEGSELTECHFEYGTSTSYGHSAACAQSPAQIGSGEAYVPVSAVVSSGLQSDTEYHFRLVAANAFGTVPGRDVTFTTAGPPSIEDEFATRVTSAAATLQAQIRPFGLDTTYRFEYGTTTGYGTSIPVPDAPAGSGFGRVAVSQGVSGLAPSTLYHFRGVATNSSGTIPGPDHTFVTEPASGSCPNEATREGPSDTLPDCRAYEQLTPVDKGDATDMFATQKSLNATYGAGTTETGFSSEIGDQFLLHTSEASFAGGGSQRNVYVLARDPERRQWTSTAFAPSGLGVASVEHFVFAPLDFSRLAVWEKVGQVIDAAPLTYHNLAGPIGGPYATLTSAEQFAESAGVVGGSADLSHVVAASRDHTVVPAAAGLDMESDALYEFVEGTPRLVDLNSARSLLSPCGAVLGQGSEVLGGAHNAVSADGSKIVFTAPDPRGPEAQTGCWSNRSAIPQTNPPQLYMRVNGTSTVDISGQPEAGVSDPTLYPAVYAGASRDGSKVFFLTKTELTTDDTGHAPELYEYNSEAPEGHRITRISRGESGTAEGSVDFVAGIAEDGSAVYFAAFRRLTEGLPNLEAGVSGDGQAYLYRAETSTGKTTYITNVDAADYPGNSRQGVAGWYGESLQPSTQHHAFVPALQTTTNWYVTGTGGDLVFASDEPLTGYDNTQAPGVKCEVLKPNGGGGGRCAEFFRYDAASSSIVCVSCAAPGTPVVDNAVFNDLAFTGSDSAPAGRPPRPISEDGKYVFFDTANALTPAAVEGREHVYEWHEGTVSLISSPGDSGDAFLMDSSPDGRDVFFGTHAQLAPSDTDQSGDLYDARIGGGFTSLAAPQCTGTGCQGLPAAPPTFATPAGVTFEGVGNFPPQSAAKPKPKPKPLTRAQKLKRALKACARIHAKRKRARCKASAMKRYGPRQRSKKSNRGGK